MSTPDHSQAEPTPVLGAGAVGGRAEGGGGVGVGASGGSGVGKRVVRVFGARPGVQKEESAARVVVPVVSFVIPCFNHGRFVREAVESCLRQTACEARVVVVNDGSDDEGSKAACEACKALPGWVEVLHQSNRGLPAARNAGAERAAMHASEYLVFLDADDTIEPAFVERLSREMRRAQGAEGGGVASGGGSASVSHAYCQERLTDKAFGTWAVPAWDPLLLLITNLHPVTALVRRECFEAIGGFDETMRRGYEDWDLWIRFSAKGWRGVRVREALFNWRRHSETTMVMEAVTRHEELYRALVGKHAALFAPRLAELVVRSNMLLRKADANWLDENLDAIVVRDLRARNIELVGEIQATSDRLESAAEEARKVRDEAERQIARIAASYERKPALRWSRRLHDVLDALPRPVAVPLRGLLRKMGRSEAE